MVVKRKLSKVRGFSGGFKMKRHLVAAALAIVSVAFGSSAWADPPPPSIYPPPPPPAAAPAVCNSFVGFFLTGCQLSWSGVRFYGVVDLGVTYQTHGTPFDPNFPTGASYFLNPPNRSPGFSLAPNAMSQSLVGIDIREPVAADWAFVARGELAFDPYSALLANAPQALQNAIGVPLNAQALPVDSSRWGWLAGQIYTGVSSQTWGTLTFGRQNSLMLDGVNAYDPQGGAYGFSPIGFSGKTCGAGDTEECRWTTAIKYSVNVDWFRFGLIGQPFTGSNSGYNAYNPNNGAFEGGVGATIPHLGPGVLSVDAMGSYVVDAVNIGPAQVGQATNGSGTPIAPFVPSYLKATVSNQTSFMALAKYSFGSWAPPPAMVTKAPVAPGPVGIPLTLYAGYEWVQFANPSNPQTSFNDDGFAFNIVGSPLTSTGGAPSANGTAINNNAFNASCGTGTGCSNEIFQVMWVGAKYGVTRDLDVIGAYYHYIQDQYVSGAGICANLSAHGQCAGTGDMWSAVLDWRFLPKWDWYIGTFFSQFNGGLINGYLSRNDLATTTGVRFRF
jgi:predicted porin